MQPASIVQGVSFRKDLRNGQRQVFEFISSDLTALNLQLPTGYGKTITGIGAYSILKHHFRVNRLLVVFPTEAQLEQFERNIAADLRTCSVDGPTEAIDLRFKSIPALQRHRKNECQIFIITIQALIHRDGLSVVKDLLQSGRWMLIVDEYHHYAVERPWMRVLNDLPVQFRLAMSATPDRPNADSGFGSPDIRISYKDAVEEQCVKPLLGHAYHYRIDATDDAGELLSFTMDELRAAVGSADPEKTEKFLITRKMRWSPKYISPLVRIPLERMQAESIRSGYQLQALIGAMCVSHAKNVCSQVKSLFPELRIDWVGTGTNGRPRAENRKIVEQFCPSSDETGRKQEPQLDVLVHVGIAGEGLDSVNVSEIVHLNKASNNISNAQENGRAARALAGAVVTGHINFDATSEYSKFTGKKIMDVMDGVESEEGEDENEGGEWEYEPEADTSLPDEPNIRIEDLEFLYVDSGDPGVQIFARVLQSHGMPLAWNEMHLNADHPDWKVLIEDYKRMRSIEAKEFNEKARIGILRDSVDRALSVVTGDIIKLMYRNGQRIERSFAGDIKKRINLRKRMTLGKLETNDEKGCQAHYNWLLDLQRELRAKKEIPLWLK